MIRSITCGHFGGAERRADDFAQRAVFALGAAEGDLIPLAAVLIDAKNADIADVVMAASVHAAGDVQADIAQIVQVIEVVETCLNRLGDRDRFGVGQRTEIATGAGNDVGEQADVGAAQIVFARQLPQRVEVGFSARRAGRCSAHGQCGFRRNRNARDQSATASICAPVTSPGGAAMPGLVDSTTLV